MTTFGCILIVKCKMQVIQNHVSLQRLKFCILNHPWSGNYVSMEYVFEARLYNKGRTYSYYMRKEGYSYLVDLFQPLTKYSFVK